MTSRKAVALLITLQSLILLGQWASSPAGPAAHADAGIPDPAGRQLQMIDELKQVNGKLDRLIGLLQDGNVVVKTRNADGK